MRGETSIRLCRSAMRHVRFHDRQLRHQQAQHHVFTGKVAVVYPHLMKEPSVPTVCGLESFAGKVEEFDLLFDADEMQAFSATVLTH